MSKKEELEKLEEEIKLQELKIKKLELEDELDTNQKDDELDTDQTITEKEIEIFKKNYPKEYKIIKWGFIGFFLLVILLAFLDCSGMNVWDKELFSLESDSQQSSSNNSPSNINSEISKTYYGCIGLEELIDDGLFMSDSLAIMQIQSQINMMSDQQCQNLIDKNNNIGQ